MAGHNKWSKVKHKKEAMGATKGKLFSKLIKEITVAARMGGGDPAHNARLRAAIHEAKSANLPSDNIARAVKKGTGELEAESYEEILYEGYGPGGVALLVQCLTDNRTRTAGEIRNLFAKNGGNLAESGSVAFLFRQRGLVVLGPADEERVMEAALEAGAEDVTPGDDGFEVTTEPAALHQVAQGLERSGFVPRSAKLDFAPVTSVRVEGDDAQRLLKLLGHLEDHDDVQSLWANAEIDDAALDQAAV